MRAAALALATAALSASLAMAQHQQQQHQQHQQQQQQPNYPTLDTPHRTPSPAQAQAAAPPSRNAPPPAPAAVVDAPASFYDPVADNEDNDDDYAYPPHLLRRNGEPGPPADSFALRPPVAPEVFEVEDIDEVYTVRPPKAQVLAPGLRRRGAAAPPADSFALHPPVAPEVFEVEDVDEVYRVQPPKPLRRRAEYIDDDADADTVWGPPPGAYDAEVEAPVRRRRSNGQLDEQRLPDPPFRFDPSAEQPPERRQISKRANNNGKDVGKGGKVLYMCQHSEWKGMCWRYHTDPAVCYNLSPLYDNRISSIGPIERGTTCWLFK
ncbi:uncharacterized protein K452DRAFT_309001 [Aplosporella prunicola CBS 121167]|uniref:Uncharacterized protein n=1 Tax=Aplosporella prunicola CBS 121167 TaxID=1176127 RepID=A0A6A6BFF1_9PEZI|nr:uncharacterized protein K452DRAFT_309001 [Aplosporella prunicola CBS 121167]KAF2141211.1 hypothetical protein K452DRAFT_309001 [Aplosporella prunicola CBS 121167]